MVSLDGYLVQCSSGSFQGNFNRTVVQWDIQWDGKFHKNFNMKFQENFDGKLNWNFDGKFNWVSAEK